MKPLYATLCLLFSLLFSGGYIVQAEGTKEIMPTFPTNATNATGLIVSTSTGFPLGNVGSYVTTTGLTPAPSDNQIKFRVKNFLTETLYYGFNWEALAPNGTPSTTPYSDVYMLIFDPTGAQVGLPINLPSGGSAAGTAGVISTWSTALFGPNISGTPSIAYYNPLTFKPTMNGDYSVSFYRSSNGGVTHNIAESMLSKYFDMTVAQTVAGAITKYTGRIHCNEWAFSVYNPSSNDIQDPLSSSNASFFAYTPDSVDVKVYFPTTGFQPLSYIIAFNNFGVKNGGNWLQDRKSIVLQQLVAPYLQGGYDVFLNQPDTSIWHPCVIPQAPSLVSPTIAGCPPGPYNVRFKAPQAGDYYMLFDLNGITGYQANSADRFIELINQSPGIITYVWDGKDGLGNVVPANTSFPISFSFRKGRINIPLYDDELNVNGFSVDGVAPIHVVKTTLYWDDTPLFNEGTDCINGVNGYSSNNNNYTGVGYNNSIVGQKAPAHAWNGDGNPGFIIPAPYVTYGGIRNDQDNVQCNDFGNARLVNTWAWGIDTAVTQTLTLTCISVTGTVWDDADGSAAGTFTNIHTGSEVGTNAGSQLYASLIDPVTNTVLTSVAVNSNGTYTLNNCPINATGMQVVISTTAGVAGSPMPPAIPSNWINTSPLVNTFNTAAANIVGVDFGIEQTPKATLQNYYIAVPILNSFVTLNGVSTISSPGPLAGSDPEDGVMGAGKTAVITQVPSNEQLYYNSVLVTNNTTIPNYTPALLQVKFISITITSTAFTYAFIDAAGKQGSSNTYTLNMAAVLATTLSSFTGRSTDAGNALNWTGLNETNGVYYTIERSTDGANYTPIGRVDGAGSGATESHAFTDPHPVPGVANYYRLQLTDLSGGSSYSNIVTIASATDNSSIVEVAPNPFQDGINIKLTLTQTGKVAVRLLDSKGMLLRQAQYGGIKGANSFQLDGLGSLPISVYFIQIILPDQVFVRKVFNR